MRNLLTGSGLDELSIVCFAVQLASFRRASPTQRALQTSHARLHRPLCFLAVLCYIKQVAIWQWSDANVGKLVLSNSTKRTSDRPASTCILQSESNRGTDVFSIRVVDKNTCTTHAAEVGARLQLYSYELKETLDSIGGGA